MSDSERRWLEEGDQWRWADHETAAEVLRLRATNERLMEALRKIDAYFIDGWPDEGDVAVIAQITADAIHE